MSKIKILLAIVLAILIVWLIKPLAAIIGTLILIPVVALVLLHLYGKLKEKYPNLKI